MTSAATDGDSARGMVLTDDPSAYQFLVKLDGLLEQLTGRKALPTIEFTDTMPSPPDDESAAEPAESPVGVLEFAPAEVDGAVKVHAVRVFTNTRRRSSAKSALCSRQEGSRVVSRTRYQDSLTSVTCQQCRKRLVEAGALPPG